MRTFRLHTLETAPAASRAAMSAAKEKFGFLPNLIRELAEAPATLQGYLALGDLLEETSLSPIERQLVLASVSLANGCEYCVAAHSAGLRMAGPGQIDAIRVAARRELNLAHAHHGPAASSDEGGHGQHQ